MAQNLAWRRGAMVALSHLCTSSSPGLLWGGEDPSIKTALGACLSYSSCYDCPMCCSPAWNPHSTVCYALSPKKHLSHPALSTPLDQDLQGDTHKTSIQLSSAVPTQRNPPLGGIRAFRLLALVPSINGPEQG